HTPGHTVDSVCFDVRVAAEPERAVLTGDTILGRGTTVLSDLGDYLASLATLSAMPEGIPALPGHGPEQPDLAALAADYLEHRRQRLDQVRAALRRLGPDASARAVVELVYADVDPALWGPAEHSVRAQLAYLAAQEETT
ncbi:MAG: MBL fold metallo-hydrolase, partial [Sciscionella sp.]